MSVKISKDMEPLIKEFENTLGILVKEDSAVMTEEGVVSDPFLRLKHILLANPGNLIAKIFLSSASDLYRKFGNNSDLYFRFLKFMFEETRKFINDKERFLFEVESLLPQAFIDSNDIDSEDFLRRHHISDLVIDAIWKADGEELLIKKGFETKIESEAGFEFKCSKREDFVSNQMSVFIIEGEPSLDVVVSLINKSVDPLLVISLSDCKELAELERLNPKSGFRFVKALPEYLRTDFILDMKSVVNQSLASSVLLSSVKALGQAKVICFNDTVNLLTKDCYIKQQRIDGLSFEAAAEKSPLRKMAIQKRISNLIGKKTVLYLKDSVETDYNVSLSYYFTQIVEASNMMLSGAGEKSVLGDLSAYSVKCMQSSLDKARTDLKLIFSPVQIQQYA